MEYIKIASPWRELPIRVELSIEPLIKYFEEFANNEKHPFQLSSQKILAEIAKFPEMRNGIKNLADIQKYEDLLDVIFEPLFPSPLQNNEIKAVSLPFNSVGFRPTKRLSNILKKAGKDFELKMEGFESERTYFFSCYYILGAYYHKNVNSSNPIFVDIPNKETGEIRHYRLLINANFTEMFKTEEAPELTDEDIDELLRNGDDLELWKKKIPPGSYIVKGFCLLNLFDNTPSYLEEQIRSIFLRNDSRVIVDLRNSLRNLFHLKNMKVGYSVYNPRTYQRMKSLLNQSGRSLLFEEEELINAKGVFCETIISNVIDSETIFALSDFTYYGKINNENGFFQRMKSRGIASIILAPVRINEATILVLELASSKKNELNPINAKILDNILPFIKIAAQRYFEEGENLVESTIQEHYTSIHPSVKWRFIEAAKRLNEAKTKGITDPILEDIIFNKIYPIYGQSDIKGSSVARNSAIQHDLELQLSLVIETFQKLTKIQPMVIFQNLIYRVQKYLDSVKDGLNAGDESGILEFLKTDIYPVFSHLKSLNEETEAIVNSYISELDPKLMVVYRERKRYEDSVTLLNERLSNYLDKKQEEAQEIFPHYYERYKTDGVEYNMYIGDSLVNTRNFHEIYLYNLRIWQLRIMCEVEQIAFDLLEEMSYPLRVASLILIHSNPLSIKFRMDEKQFDVDGAYNVRYEIVKKRIDKAYIKGTNERLTQPDKIAIVYSQEEDAAEYLSYIEFLQSENLLGKIEMLDLEDLQGLSGLKAIRVEVIYKKKKGLKNGSFSKEKAVVIEN